MTDYTTVALRPEVKERLEEYKFEARCDSFTAAVDSLLDKEVST